MDISKQIGDEEANKTKEILSKRIKDEEANEKRELLYQFWMLENEGIQLNRRFGMEDDIGI